MLTMVLEGWRINASVPNGVRARKRVHITGSDPVICTHTPGLGPDGAGDQGAKAIDVTLSIGLAALGPFYLALARHPIIIRAGQPIALLVLLAVVRASHIDGEALVAHLARNVSATTDRSIATTPARTLGMNLK